MPVHLEFTSTNTRRNMIGFQPVGGQEALAGWNDDAYKAYFNASILHGKFPNGWNLDSYAYVPNDLVEIDIDVLGNLVVKSGGNIIYTGQAPVADYQIAVSSSSSGSIDNIQLSANQVGAGQVFLSEFPEDLQLYARDVQTNKAFIPIEGTVSNPGDSVSVVILRNGQPYAQEGIRTTGQNFAFNPEIDAELAEYTIQLYLTTLGNTILHQQANRVVAGDVYVITGQSNAEAKTWGGGNSSENLDDFVRVYGLGTPTPDTLLNNLQWFIGQGNGDRDTQGNTGQWGLKLAKQIIDNHGVPVCIFNGARGGWRIELFLRDNADPDNLDTNYGRLLYRLNRTKLTDKIRAIFWYQGETDVTLGTTIAEYKQMFTSIYDGWQMDFPGVEKTYITQNKDGCWATPQQNVIIQEALRQLADELPDTEIMSTKGVAHFGCHFPYYDGYEELGRRYYELVNQDIYRQNVPYANAPDIKKALFAANDEIIIETKGYDELTWQNYADTLFYMEGSNATFTGGYTLGNYVVLQLDTDGTNATGLTYYDKAREVNPFIVNDAGLGLVSFYDFPIGTNNPPIAIGESFTTGQNIPLNDALSTNDSDPDGDNLVNTITPITPPSNGTLNINPDGTFTYTPNPGFYGDDNFIYEVCDDYILVTSYTGQVNSGADDVEEIRSNGNIYTNSSDLEFVNDNNRGDQTIGIRITNITIPKGAIITSAYFEFVADESHDMMTELNISAEATGNALPIPTTTYALTSKTKTTAVSSWTDIPAWAEGNTYLSADISPVVQEITNRADWQSNNAMTFLIEGTGRRIAESYEGDAALAPKLKITYKDPGNSLSIQQCDEAIVNITVEQLCMELNISAFLEGAYDATANEMTTELSSTRRLLPGQTPTSNLITPTPAGQPYSAAPWNYMGTEGANWTDADYTGNETDWVLVSFRTGTAKNTEVAMTAALLMKDGSIEFPNRCALSSTVTNPLYIVVEHRNHIGVMTPQAIDVINGTLTYDFRLSDSYRDVTGFGQKQTPTGEWAMYAGDADQSDFPSFDINGTDKTLWFDNNGVFDYYLSPDFNLDGDINGQDKSLWFDNNGISSRVPK